jgi:hypothetical protein
MADLSMLSKPILDSYVREHYQNIWIKLIVIQSSINNSVERKCVLSAGVRQDLMRSGSAQAENEDEKGHRVGREGDQVKNAVTEDEMQISMESQLDQYIRKLAKSNRFIFTITALFAAYRSCTSQI